MQTKSDLRWKHAGGSIAATAGKKSFCIPPVLSMGIFATGFSACASEEQYFYGDDQVENSNEDDQRALVISWKLPLSKRDILNMEMLG